LNKVKKDHQQRIEGLEIKEKKFERCAQLILQHVELVDACISSLRASLSVKMNWNNLKKIIKEEKQKGNLSAQIIHKLKIDDDKVTILLYDKYLDEVYDEEQETNSAEPIDIIISISAYANATEYFNLKKKLLIKKKRQF